MINILRHLVWATLVLLRLLHAQGVTKTLQDQITLTLEKDGKEFKQTFSPVEIDHFPGRYSLIKEEGDWLDARDNSTDPLYLKNLDRIYFYEYLPEHKGRLRPP